MKPLLSFSHRSDKGAKPIDPKGFPWVDLKRCRHCHFAYNHHHQLFDNGTLGNQRAQKIIDKKELILIRISFRSGGTISLFHLHSNFWFEKSRSLEKIQVLETWFFFQGKTLGNINCHPQNTSRVQIKRLNAWLSRLSDLNGVKIWETWKRSLGAKPSWL